jgi:AraC family transcriptional regulator
MRTYDLDEGRELSTVRTGHYLTQIISSGIEGNFVYPEMAPSASSMIQWGRLGFIPSGLPVRFRMGRGRLRTCQCVFEPARFEELAGGALEWDLDRLRAYLNIRNPQIDLAMRRLRKEAAEPGFAQETLIEAVGTLVAIDLLRSLRGEAPKARDSVSGLAPWQLRRIEEYVQDLGCERPMDVSTFAQLCGLSPAHLARRFKRATGTTIHAYVEGLRIDRARRLLAENKLSLKQIAAASGFSTHSYFTAAYRRATGETPSAYRARMAAKVRPAARPR